MLSNTIVVGYLWQRGVIHKTVEGLRVFGLAFPEAHLTNQGSRLVAKTLRDTVTVTKK